MICAQNAHENFKHILKIKSAENFNLVCTKQFVTIQTNIICEFSKKIEIKFSDNIPTHVFSMLYKSKTCDFLQQSEKSQYRNIINKFFERELVIKSDYNSKRAFLNTPPPLAVIHYSSRRMRGFCPPFGIRA